jgi:hypothetical protein
MKRWLLLCSALVAVTVPPAARAQYIYMDTNGDGICNFTDILVSSVTAVGVYLDTNHNASGSTVKCATNSAEPLDIFSYDIVFHSTNDPITLDGWTNAMSGFTVVSPFTVAGREAGVGYTAPIGGNLAPGRYKLGTLHVTASSVAGLDFIGLNSNPSIPSFGTGFGTSCDASDFANTEVLGTDFFDVCVPPYSRDDVQATTWGKIKMIYR